MQNGFQLKLGPSLLTPETLKTIRPRPSIGWEVKSSESQYIDLDSTDSIGFVGRHHIAVQDVEGRRLSTPIHITSFTPGDPVTIQFLNHAKKKEPEISQKKSTSLSRWYKPRRPTKSIKDLESKNKQKKEKDKVPNEKEIPVTNKHSKTSKLSFIGWKREDKQAEPVIVEQKSAFNKPEKPEKPILRSPKKEKKAKFKKKNIEVKPKYETRRVATSGKVKVEYREPFSKRCANGCYRICCKFYCCLTMLIIITGVVIFAF